MNRLVYNASIGAGLLSVAVGAGLQWGLPFALIVGGALAIALTIVSLIVEA